MNPSSPNDGPPQGVGGAARENGPESAAIGKTIIVLSHGTRAWSTTKLAFLSKPPALGLSSDPAGGALFQKCRDAFLGVGGHQVHGHDLFGVAVRLVLIQIDLVVECLLADLDGDTACVGDAGG